MITTTTIREILGADFATEEIVARMSNAFQARFPDGILSDELDTIIRVVRPEDAPLIAAMAWLTDDHTTPLTHPKQDGLHVVAVQEGAIVGEAFGHGEMSGDDHTSITFTLDNIIVHAGRRQGGIGIGMGQAMIGLVEAVRQEAGQLRLGHTFGRITVEGDVRPDSPAACLLEALQSDTDMIADMPANVQGKYIIADQEADTVDRIVTEASGVVVAHRSAGNLWGHIFEEAGGRICERHCRFVYDTEDEAIIHLEIRRGNAWQSATDDEMADVEDSLKNANPEAIEDPDSHGLRVTNDLPDWIMDTPAPGM